MRNLQRSHINRAESPKVPGKVKFFDAEKGFGFIIPADGGKDVFFRGEKIVKRHQGKPINNGQAVLYRLGTDHGKGAPALDVEIIEETSNG